LNIQPAFVALHHLFPDFDIWVSQCQSQEVFCIVE
jgi:hypothetical protein